MVNTSKWYDVTRCLELIIFLILSTRSETLRKYSTVGVLLRIADEDYPVPDTSIVIEKGTQVLVPVYAIHNDEGSGTFFLKYMKMESI